MLSDIKKSYLDAALRLPKRYEEYSIDELANRYCTAVDRHTKPEQDMYFAALVLRFWYKIDRLYNENKQFSQEREEFYSWLVEAILYACKYKGWQKKRKKTNAQSCINQCINTIRLQHIYDANLDKNRANMNTVSFDQPMRDSDTTTAEYDALSDVTEDEDEAVSESTLNMESIVQRYIDNKRIIESIIIDTIAFQNCTKETKETVKVVGEDGKKHKQTVKAQEFWRYAVIKYLSSLPRNYADYFANRYRVDPILLKAGLTKIRKCNNTKLYSFLDRTLASAKRNYVAE